MELSKFMTSKGLDDEAIASLIRANGVSCNRSTVSRLRRGKVWLSKDLALAIKSATDGLVTADDFLTRAPNDEAAA